MRVFCGGPQWPFAAFRLSGEQEGPPPIHHIAHRFGLVVLGNGGADITRPSMQTGPIQGAGEVFWTPPDAIQATARHPVPPGRLRELVQKSTTNPNSYK